MGRGLSELQKTMLRLAIDEEINDENVEWKKKTFGGVGLSEVAEAYYGWKPVKRGYCKVEFCKKDIKGYNAGKVAIFKAARRLVERDLIRLGMPGTRYYAGSSVYYATPKAFLQDPRFNDLVKLRYLEDINLLSAGGYMHPKGKIIEVPRYEAERMLKSGVFEMV